MRVTMKRAKFLGERSDPAREPGGKPWVHDEFAVTLDCDGRRLETPWKQGTGHRTAGGAAKKPEAADVLSSLLMDASGGTETFADWCDNLGESTDSRRALDLYLRLQEIGAELRALLGMSAETAVKKFGNGDSEEAARVLCSAEPVLA